LEPLKEQCPLLRKLIVVEGYTELLLLAEITSKWSGTTLWAVLFKYSAGTIWC